MDDLLEQLRVSLEKIGAPELANNLDQVKKDVDTEEAKKKKRKGKKKAEEGNRLPEEIHLKPNKDIPEKLYSKIEEVYDIAADVREAAAFVYNFTANANPGTASITERQVKLAVVTQAILSAVSQKYQSKTKSKLNKALKKAKKDLLLIRDTLTSSINKVDTTKVPEDEHKIREKDQPPIDIHEYEEYNDEIEEEEAREKAESALEDKSPEEAPEEEKQASILITAVENAPAGKGMGRHRTRRFVRELKRPRIKKIYRYRACVRPEWHRSATGKYRWRSKCIRTDGTGKPTVKLIYLGFDRAKRPTKIKVKGKNVPVVDESRYEKLLARLRKKHEKKKTKVKPPKAKIPPGKEVKPKEKAEKKPKEPEKKPEEKPKEPEKKPEEKPKKKPEKPTKKPKKKRKKKRPRKSPAAKARENPKKTPHPAAEVKSREIGKIARRSWAKDAVVELSDTISRHPALMQTAAVGIGAAAQLWHMKTYGSFPPDYISAAQYAAMGIGVAASLQSPDPFRLTDHVSAGPMDYMQTMIQDQINQAFGIKYMSHEPTPLTVTETLDQIDSAVSPDNIPYRVRGKAVKMVKKLDPQNPPALDDIQKLEKMQRVGMMDEVTALRKKVEEEKDPEKKKQLEVELDEKEHKIDVVKRRIQFKLDNWRLQKYDKFAYKKKQERLQRRKRNLKMYILDIERKLKEVPEGNKERRERLEERKRESLRELNSPPYSEI